MILEDLAADGQGQRHRLTAEICSEIKDVLERNRGPSALADAYRPAGRHQQPHQRHEADGLWIPG